MADKQKSPVTGGNTPKPKPTGGGSQSAKDKSRAASRPVAAKPPGKGGKPGGKPAAAGAGSSRTGLYIAWGAVALVVVIIGTLFIVNATKSNTQDLSYTPVTPAPAQVVHDVTTIPTSTWDKVGVSDTSVAKPTVLTGQPDMSLNGKSPAMLYYGAEYCPYCAAERWAMAAALARFGTWSNLQITASSHVDVDADHPHLQLPRCHARQPVHHVQGDRAVHEHPGVGKPRSVHQPPEPDQGGESDPGQVQLLQVPARTAAPTGRSRSRSWTSTTSLLFSGASYDPQILAGLTWTDISGSLSDPTNPVTQAILTTGNYMSAGICNASHGQPGSVCTSSGVQAAAKALGISAS